MVEHRRRTLPMRSIAGRASSAVARGSGERSQWDQRQRQIERRRKRFSKLLLAHPFPPELFIRLTHSSFVIEQLAVTREQVISALVTRCDGRAMGKPFDSRVRNHVAILRQLERSTRMGLDLSAARVMRWYTLISGGLSIASLDATRAAKLGQLLQRMASPPLRLEKAIAAVAASHIQLLKDPLFPGFNGILSRLLLKCHLARSQLPPVVFSLGMERLLWRARHRCRHICSI